VSAKTRRERETAETRNKILDAARELFAEHGYQAVTMRSIAQRIGYTATSIYFHFADKEALLREICRLDFLAFAREFARSSAVADPLARLKSIGWAYVQFALEHPNHFRLMFMTPLPPQQPALAKGDPAEDAYAYLLQCVREALAAGRFRPDLEDAELLAQLLWAGVHGVASLYVVKGKDPWVAWAGVEPTARLMMDALVAGLTAPAHPAGEDRGHG
jgi:AcrR family transcriptional regulator